MVAAASQSITTERSLAPFSRRGMVSRSQAAALRPGDQIAAPWGSAWAPVLSWPSVWSLSRVAAVLNPSKGGMGK
jgi:hypothetical protein